MTAKINDLNDGINSEVNSLNREHSLIKVYLQCEYRCYVGNIYIFFLSGRPLT